MKSNGVKALLMGGQACVLHGAAEFSRDIDFAILADDANFARLEAASGSAGSTAKGKAIQALGA